MTNPEPRRSGRLRLCEGGLSPNRNIFKHLTETPLTEEVRWHTEDSVRSSSALILIFFYHCRTEAGQCVTVSAWCS